MPELTHKTCSKCNENQSVDRFSRRQFSPSGNWGYVSWCHACRSVKFKKEWSDGSYRDSVYRRKFGITLADYDAMLLSQDYKCAICLTEDPRGHGQKNKRFHVDHDHATGEVRGLLCHDCNVGLGHFKDRTDIMKDAIHYLDRHEDGVSNRLLLTATIQELIARIETLEAGAA